MIRVLCVSSTEKITAFLRECFENDYTKLFSLASTVEEAEGMLDEKYDLIIINGPVAGKHGCELALHASEVHPSASIILIVKEELAEEMASRLEPQGVFVVPKPLNKNYFYGVLRLCAVAHSKLVGIEDENRQLKEKLAEVRLVDRAKLLLMQVLNLSETEAHRMIEKQAMDLRLPRRNVAENIIKTYENT